MKNFVTRTVLFLCLSVIVCVPTTQFLGCGGGRKVTVDAVSDKDGCVAVASTYRAGTKVRRSCRLAATQACADLGWGECIISEARVSDGGCGTATEIAVHCPTNLKAEK